MFHITIDNRVFAVSFIHEILKDETSIVLPSGKRKQIIAITKAFFKEKINDDYVLVGESIALCSASDKFNKSRGRKVAFTRLLEELPYNSIFSDRWVKSPEVYEGVREPIDRPIRTMLWEAYLNKINLPRTATAIKLNPIEIDG